LGKEVYSVPREMMILVCHASDGHFADGDRRAVRRVLERSEHITEIHELGPERYVLVCADGGRVELRAPGLGGQRAFHRIELYPERWTPGLVSLVFELMSFGGFGLMNNLEMPQFIVTQPQQVSYFPWLPEPPLLVRNPRDLGYSIGL
jgi:hypothetical protein